MADRISWLVLLYRIPSEPSRLRAAVWRRLKAAGAVYLAGSVAALPASPAAERSLRRLRHDVCDMGGSAQLLRAEALAGQPDVIAAFNAARDGQYIDIAARCRDLLTEIESAATAGHFTYAKLEEKAAVLAKLAGRYEQVRAVDAFCASKSEPASSALARCREALNGFAERTYRAEDGNGK